MKKNEQILSPETFRCTKCGECCRMIVKVSEKDIKRIEELNYTRQEFIEYDTKINSNTLKQNRGVCTFLKRQGGGFTCSIYDHRPELCKKYPFIEKYLKLTDCRPQGYERWMDLKEMMEK